MDRASLDALQRRELIERARSLGVERPEVMTRDELIDEQLRLNQAAAAEARGSGAASVRGWFGVARDLLAGLVEQGFHLPDAAKVIRGDGTQIAPSARRPVATVTLAEIYAAQGHVSRGVSVLQEVLEKEPEHEVARRLLGELGAKQDDLGQQEAATPTLRTPRIEGAAAGAVAADSAPAAARADASAGHDQIRAEDEVGGPADSAPGAEPAPVKPPAAQAPAVQAIQAPAVQTPAMQTPVVQTPIAQGPDVQAHVAPAAGSERIAQTAPDSCLLFVSESRVVVSWKLSEESFAQLRSALPLGSPVVRVLCWQPGLPAQAVERELAITQSSGELLVELPSPAAGPQAGESVVRGVLGWQAPDLQFRVVATAVVAPLAVEGGEQLPIFRPHVAAGIADLESRRVVAQTLLARYA